MLRKLLSAFIIISFFLTTLGPLPQAHADAFLGLPRPGSMVNLSPAYEPALIKGLTVHKDNPFLFDFIVDTGNDLSLQGPSSVIKKESNRLIKYFFACLTIPEKDLWVNLSPYEKDKIVPQGLGQTALGRDLLAQDYILKQVTASLIYPEKNLGKEFWDRVYAKARQLYGTTQIPVNTFNKVWILADKATVYEHNQTAFVVSGHLKVMLEEDYLALQKHNVETPFMASHKDAITRVPTTNNISSSILRSIILPEIEKEVNQGQNFAMLRQILYSQILATWYKKNLKEALLNQVYADRGTVKGIERSSISTQQDLSPETIYQQYLKAYKKGVFDYIKEDAQPDGQSISRKYFSGGFKSILGTDGAMTVTHDFAMGAQASIPTSQFIKVSTFESINGTKPPITTPDAAMMSAKDREMLDHVGGIVRLKGNAAAEQFVLDSMKDFGIKPEDMQVLDNSDDQRLLKEETADNPDFVQLANKKDYHAYSDPKDTARSAARTFVVTDNKEDQGKYNNWKETGDFIKETRKKIADAYAIGKKKKIYIIPYLMGPVNSKFSQVGIQLSDSRYVAINTDRMATVGEAAIDHLNKQEGEERGVFERGIQIAGDLTKVRRGEKENGGIDDRYFVLHRNYKEIFSTGSEYGGNVLFGKKFQALRQAMYDGSHEGWLAEHMFLLEVEDLKGDFKGRKRYVAGAFPSGTGKTTTAFSMVPDEWKDQYKTRAVGDDIVWMRKGEDGRLYAINPEAGAFGIIPDVGWDTNPNFMKLLEYPDSSVIYTNTAFNPVTGEVWWENKTKEFPSLKGDGKYWQDWKKQRIIDRNVTQEDVDRNKKFHGRLLGSLSEDERLELQASLGVWAHENSRATVRLSNGIDLDVVSMQLNNPQGVPVSAILLGGRNDNEPVIYQTRDAEHGIYAAANIVSRSNATVEGKKGQMVPDFFAQRDFMSIPEVGYIDHEEKMAAELGDRGPKYFHVNYYRDGWPGYRSNFNLILWALDRADGKGEAVEKPFGFVPTADALMSPGLEKHISKTQLAKILDYGDPEFLKKRVAQETVYLKSLETGKKRFSQAFWKVNEERRKAFGVTPEALSMAYRDSVLIPEVKKMLGSKESIQFIKKYISQSIASFVQTFKNDKWGDMKDLLSYAVDEELHVAPGSIKEFLLSLISSDTLQGIIFESSDQQGTAFLDQSKERIDAIQGEEEWPKVVFREYLLDELVREKMDRAMTVKEGFLGSHQDPNSKVLTFDVSGYNLPVTKVRKIEISNGPTGWIEKYSTRSVAVIGVLRVLNALKTGSHVRITIKEFVDKNDLLRPDNKSASTVAQLRARIVYLSRNHRYISNMDHLRQVYGDRDTFILYEILTEISPVSLSEKVNRVLRRLNNQFIRENSAEEIIAEFLPGLDPGPPFRTDVAMTTVQQEFTRVYDVLKGKAEFNVRAANGEDVKIQTQERPSRVSFGSAGFYLNVNQQVILLGTLRRDSTIAVSGPFLIVNSFWQTPIIVNEAYSYVNVFYLKDAGHIEPVARNLLSQASSSRILGSGFTINPTIRFEKEGNPVIGNTLDVDLVKLEKLQKASKTKMAGYFLTKQLVELLSADDINDISSFMHPFEQSFVTPKVLVSVPLMHGAIFKRNKKTEAWLRTKDSYYKSRYGKTLKFDPQTAVLDIDAAMMGANPDKLHREIEHMFRKHELAGVSLTNRVLARQASALEQQKHQSRLERFLQPTPSQVIESILNESRVTKKQAKIKSIIMNPDKTLAVVTLNKRGWLLTASTKRQPIGKIFVEVKANGIVLKSGLLSRISVARSLASNDMTPVLESLGVPVSRDHAAVADLEQGFKRGGIDLNSANMGMTVTKDAQGGVQVTFDQGMIARIKAQGVQSANPVIISITPMSAADIRPLLVN